jgi:hypothetical protein
LANRYKSPSFYRYPANYSSSVLKRSFVALADVPVVRIHAHLNKNGASKQHSKI